MIVICRFMILSVICHVILFLLLPELSLKARPSNKKTHLAICISNFTVLLLSLPWCPFLTVHIQLFFPVLLDVWRGFHGWRLQKDNRSWPWGIYQVSNKSSIIWKPATEILYSIESRIKDLDPSKIPSEIKNITVFISISFNIFFRFF